MIKIELENLGELDVICWSLEFAMKEDKIRPDDRENVKKMLEKLRNDLEAFKDLKREQD